MKRQHILLPAIVISLLLLQLTFAASPRYEITDLGTLGGNFSCAYSINDSGQIVGDSESSSGHRHATLFDQTGNGNNIDLGTLGSGGSSAYSINNNGQIVGWADKSQYFMRATLFDPTGSGNNTDLGAWPGSPAYPETSCAISINDAGQIVGWTMWTIGRPPLSKTFTRAALFDPSGAVPIRLLGTPIGGYDSVALSINNSGQIVGWADIRGWPSYSRATLFDPTGNGSNIDLGTLDGYGSVAYSINNNGQIVGSAQTTSGERDATQFDPTGTGQWHATQFVPPGTSQRHATLFDTSGNGNNIDLGTLGGDESCATSINESGKIVGWVYNSENDSRATLFDPSGNGNNLDLNTLIHPDSGWTLTHAYSINNHGWIVGKGINPDGEEHAFLMTPVLPKTIYVDDDANGANDGSSWTDAYNYLQDALTAAYSGDEIWVAQGIYKPDQEAGITPGDREATFQLINGVTLKGGYAGFGEPDPNARDIQLYETILTGDLADNDVNVNEPCDLQTEPTRSENSYHVVRSTGTDESAVLDGFTVTGGNANGPYPEYCHGGGMRNEYSSSTVSNCTFSANSGNCSNSAGMVNEHSSPKVTNCTFIGNNRCGIANWYNNTPTLTNCTFIGNGLGVANHYDSSSTLRNCKFIGNREGIESFGGITTLTNCIFSGNRRATFFDYSSSKPMLLNCTFSGNAGVIGVDGGAIATLNNCVLWGNERLQYDYDGVLIMNYSCIQGGWPGDGNIDTDPCFVSPGYWANVNDPNIIIEPNDPNAIWIEGDYHLLQGSPCIDTGDPNYIVEPNETDLDGKPRVIGGRIDMGAYELPVPAEVRIVPRIINLASKGKWITCYIWLPEEYNVVDIDSNSVLLEDVVQAVSLSVDEQKEVAIAKFSRSEIQEILNAGEVELAITGQLTDGTIFEATDTIKVIDKAGKK